MAVVVQGGLTQQEAAQGCREMAVSFYSPKFFTIPEHFVRVVIGF